MLTEKFLHFVWRYGLFSHIHLETTQREKVEIVHPGVYNTNQGPDFKDARIRFENNLFAGNIELHIHNDEWYEHHHHKDAHYSNCILHVVFEPTSELFVTGINNTMIPILSLHRHIHAGMLEHYQYMMKQQVELACTHNYTMPEMLAVLSFKNKLLAERINRKSESIKQMLKKNHEHWEMTFYHHLASSFGNRVNQSYFLSLAESIPLTLINKYQSEPLKLQALFFGQSNLLNGADEYANRLKQEYDYLKKLHQLEPLKNSPYFLRMRPSSFPTIRLAQLIALIYQSKNLFSKLMHGFHPKDLYPYFDVNIDPYWKEHYHFGKKFKKPIEGKLGINAIQGLVINTITPFIFLYDQLHHPDSDRFILFLESLNKENNYRIRSFTAVLPVDNKNAADSQAIIEWHQQYCCAKRCLDCVVGYHTLKRLNLE